MKKYLGKILTGVAILLGVVAIVMLAAPGLAPKSDYKALGVVGSHSMADITFGKTDSLTGTGFGFSFLNLLTFLLVAVGVVCAIVAVLGKGGKVVPIVATVAFVAAGVLFFCAKQMYTIKLPDGVPDEVAKEVKDGAKKELNEIYTLGAGAIVGGVLSILAGAAALVPVFVKPE